MMKHVFFLFFLLSHFYQIAQLVFPFKDNANKWGFKNLEGKLIVEPKYVETKFFTEGLCAVKNEANKWGYIDSTGKEVITYEYEIANNFQEGLACVQKEGKPFQYINKEGKPIIDVKYSYCGNFKEGLAIIREDKSSYNKLFGYINKSGEVVIKPQFIEVKDFIDAHAFVKFDFGTTSNKEKEYPWGVINTKGEVIKKPCFRFEPGKFIDGLAKQCPPEKDHERVYGFVNPKGEWIINAKYYNVNDFNNGFAIVEKEKGVYGLINNKGKTIIDAKYVSIDKISQTTFIAINADNQKELYNEKGEKIIKSPMYDVKEICDNWIIAADVKNQKYGAYDLAGKMILPHDYRSINACPQDGWYKAHKYIDIVYQTEYNGKVQYTSNDDELFVSEKGESYYIPKKNYTGYDDYYMYYQYEERDKKTKNDIMNWFVVDRVSGDAIKITSTPKPAHNENNYEVIAVDSATFILKKGETKQLFFVKGKGKDLKVEALPDKFTKYFSMNDCFLIENKNDRFIAIYNKDKKLIRKYLKASILDIKYDYPIIEKYDTITGKSYILLLNPNSEELNLPNNEAVRDYTYKILNGVQFINENKAYFFSKDSLYFIDCKTKRLISKFRLKRTSQMQLPAAYKKFFPVVETDSTLSFINMYTLKKIAYNIPAHDYMINQENTSFMYIYKNKLCGMIDSTGKIIIPVKFKNRPIYMGSYMAVRNSYYRITDLEGNEILPNVFDHFVSLNFKDGTLKLDRNKPNNSKMIYTIKNGVIIDSVLEVKKSYAASDSQSDFDNDKVQCPHCSGMGNVTSKNPGKKCWNCSGSGKSGWKTKERESIVYGNAVSIRAIHFDKYTEQACTYCRGKGYIGKETYQDENCSLCNGSGKVSNTLRNEYIKKFNK